MQSTGREKRSTRRAKIQTVALFALGIVLFSFTLGLRHNYFFSSEESSTIIPTQQAKNFPWNPELMHHLPDQCEKTLVFPFRVGCPSSCDNYLNASSKSTSLYKSASQSKDPSTQRQREPLPYYYRIHMAWDFGKVLWYDPQQHENETEHPRRFRAPLSMVRRFVQSSDRLTAQVQRQAKKLGLNATQDDSPLQEQLFIKPQTKMHLSLAYFCCIPEEDAVPVQFAMQDWIASRTRREVLSSQGAPKLGFESLRCWKERFDSITNIIVADKTSQGYLMTLYLDLVNFVQKAVPSYNPMIVPRQDQMPFHVTLSGVHYGDIYGGNSIDPLLPVMAKITQEITQETDWQSEMSNVPLNYLPYVSNPAIHNQPSVNQ